MSEILKPTTTLAPDIFVSSQDYGTREDKLRRENVVATHRAMNALMVMQGDEVYFEAADPGYKSSFTRDSLVAMSLAGDATALKTQIAYSARRLGKKYDAVTGEEPGKAHHELPSYVDQALGLSTAYNACDTTAELLRGIATLAGRGDRAIVAEYGDVIRRGVGYIKRHVNEQGLFAEWPQAGAERFALKVTYWKDSELNRFTSREPHYPIVYTLAHFQNADALQQIGRATGDSQLVRYGRYMTEAGIKQLWSGDHFVTAIDAAGVVDPPSTDSLMALLYIAPDQLPDGCAEQIEKYTQPLATDAGYRSGLPAAQDIDPYHMGVWTHEQALLHAAAQKHGLKHAMGITERIANFISPAHGMFPELLDADTLRPAGNTKQLWAMGAYLYFHNSAESLLGQ